MIFLPKKDIQNPPARLLELGARRQLRRVTDLENGNLFTPSYYPHSSVTDLLRAYSIHKDALAVGDQPKCNYCESQVEKGMTLQVEHYRPRAKVEAVDNGNQPHTGYYWLGIEWSNLLLACAKCNGKNAKGNRFPIRGPRAQALAPVNQQNVLSRDQCYSNQNPLILEDPLLINPEIDHPEDFLTFDQNGYLHAHGQDPLRGNMSIEIYQLNRDSLLAARIEILNNFNNEINLHIAAHMMQAIGNETLTYVLKNLIRQIIKRDSPEREFTLWGRHFNQSIEECIIAYIGNDYYKDLFRQFYAEVTAE